MDSIIYQCCVYSLSVATPIKVIDEIPTFDEGKTKTNGKISFEFDSTLTDYQNTISNVIAISYLAFLSSVFLKKKSVLLRFK